MTARKGGPDDKESNAATSSASQGKTAKESNNWLAGTYNPPAILPPLPVFASPPAAARACDIPGRAPWHGGLRGAWALQRGTEVRRDIARLKRQGILRTPREVAIYRRDSIRTIGQTAATYRQSVELVDQVMSLKKKIDMGLGFVAGEVKNFNPSVWGVAKTMALMGLAKLKSFTVDTGDAGLNRLLNNVQKWLETVFKSPLPLLMDQAKEDMQRRTTP